MCFCVRQNRTTTMTELERRERCFFTVIISSRGLALSFEIHCGAKSVLLSHELSHAAGDLQSFERETTTATTTTTNDEHLLQGCGTWSPSATVQPLSQQRQEQRTQRSSEHEENW